MHCTEHTHTRQEWGWVPVDALCICNLSCCWCYFISSRFFLSPSLSLPLFMLLLLLLFGFAFFFFHRRFVRFQRILLRNIYVMNGGIAMDSSIGILCWESVCAIKCDKYYCFVFYSRKLAAKPERIQMKWVSRMNAIFVSVQKNAKEGIIFYDNNNKICGCDFPLSFIRCRWWRRWRYRSRAYSLEVASMHLK